jgi:hypothetical protein
LRDTRVLGIDFTSAPRPAKPITIAGGRIDGDAFVLESIELAHDFAAFEALLQSDGPWIAGIDAPFGLPREAVLALGWPECWPQLVEHCARLGREAFRAALDRYRESRPVGNRYAHRATDYPAGSHSPLKLVNPPVGLMFLECAPRLLRADVTIPGLHRGRRRGSAPRVALEAYPGYTARALVAGSYKSDERAKQTPPRRAARQSILRRLRSGDHPLALQLTASRTRLAELVDDPSGDTLDATIAAMQAGWSLLRSAQRFGLPRRIDPLEGWIATVPHMKASSM